MIMATRLLLPPPEAIAKLLNNLFDKRVHVARASAPFAVPAYRAVCDYVDAEQATLFACVCDVALLGSVGAALAMIPPAQVVDAVRTGKPSDALRENAYEVFNVASSIFNEVAGCEVHVKLRALTLAPPIPPALVAKLAKPTTRLDLDITVPGYPVGKLSLLALAQ